MKSFPILFDAPEQSSRLTHPTAFGEIGVSSPKMNTVDSDITEDYLHERALQGGIGVPLMVRDLDASRISCPYALASSTSARRCA